MSTSNERSTGRRETGPWNWTLNWIFLRAASLLHIHSYGYGNALKIKDLLA
jgi:hypothetical protein